MAFPAAVYRVQNFLNDLSAKRDQVAPKVKDYWDKLSGIAQKIAPTATEWAKKIDQYKMPPRMQHFVNSLSAKGYVQGLEAGFLAGLTSAAVTGFFADEDKYPSLLAEIYSASTVATTTRLFMDAICNGGEVDIPPPWTWLRKAVPYGAALIARNWVFGNDGTKGLGDGIYYVLEKTPIGGNIFGIIPVQEMTVLSAGVFGLALMQAPNLADALGIETEKDKNDKDPKKAESKVEPKPTQQNLSQNPLNRSVSLQDLNAYVGGVNHVVGEIVRQSLISRAPKQKKSEEQKRPEPAPAPALPVQERDERNLFNGANLVNPPANNNSGIQEEFNYSAL